MFFKYLRTNCRSL